jgi:hypothetical protein
MVSVAIYTYLYLVNLDATTFRRLISTPLFVTPMADRIRKEVMK